jgi:hypothetical protein
VGDGEAEGGVNSSCYGWVGGCLDGGAEGVLFGAGEGKGGLGS